MRPVAWLLWPIIFPLGRRAQAPSDRLGHKVASILMTPNDARDRLAEGVFTTKTPTDAYRGAGRPEVTFAVERIIDDGLTAAQNAFHSS